MSNLSLDTPASTHSFHSPPRPTIRDLENRCQILLTELETFRAHLRTLNRENTIETGTIRHTLQSELKSLRKASSSLASGAADEDNCPDERTAHLLRSSNLPFLEAVWNTAKRSQAVTGFSKRMYWEPDTRKAQPSTNGQSLNGDDQENHPIKQTQHNQPQRRRHFATVDIVASAGAEWIKISSISESRLIFELAGQGWHEDDSLDDSDNDSDTASLASNSSADSTGTSGISIVRMAKNLARAARTTRVRYKHPRVRFILPKISPGRNPQIDVLLAAVRATGAILETAESYSATISTPIPVADALPSMISTPFDSFSATLNIDCTILLALVSDLSHTRSVTPEPWFHKAMRRQIEREESENLLPQVLYPAMGGRKLVCTGEAAQRMREIVETIGTDAEKERTRFLLGDGFANELDGEARYSVAFKGMEKLSQHAVPPDWKIPVNIIDTDEDAALVAATTQPPSLASKISPHLTPINRSIFLFGWRLSHTTITSNRTVARQIERLVEEELDREGARVDKDGDGEVGPDVWVCTCSRSLIGKEKGRR